MTDRLEERLAELAEPQAMDGEFRWRLERAMIASAGGPAAATGSPARWRIDWPREMRPRFRARLERAMVRRRTPARSLIVRLAAAIAALLVASTVMVVTDRVSAPRHDGSVPLLTAPTATPTTAGPQAPAARPPGSLHAFRSSAEFLRYVRTESLKIAGPFGIESVGLYNGVPFGRGPATTPVPAPVTGAPGGAPAAQPAMPNSAGSNYSPTNVQEEGVDEPDTVKTDGKRLVIVARSAVWLLDVTDGGARLKGSVKIPNGVGAFLAGDRVLVFSRLAQAPPEAKKATHARQRPWTKVTVVDISSLAKPKIVSAFQVEGSYVGARLVGGVVRLIIQSGALGPEPVALKKYSEAEFAAAEAGNKRAIKTSFLGDWMPHYVVQKPGGGTVTGHVHDWSAVSRPPDKAGVSMLTLLTIDPADPRPDNAQSIMGAGEIVYSSLENLYVTSYRLDDVIAIRNGKRPKEPLTRIHKFDIRDPSRARYVGSGEVAGFLLNQFSLSEHEGYLRVATTLGINWAAAGSTESAVTVLREKAGQLIRVGSVGNLGVGERIYSVRFIGSMAYVVTFRQIDPLFVIDLRKPTLPKVRGKLKVPGYSGYLHPLSETLLLGIGRAADKNGNVKGVQFSLFDVSDPSEPRRLHAKTVGENGTASVEHDHHAFLYWAPRRLAVVPAEIFEGSGSDLKQIFAALALTVSADKGFGEPVRLTHQGRTKADPYEAAIQRSLVIGGRLLTVSEAGVLVSDLKTLTDRVWVALQ